MEVSVKDFGPIREGYVRTKPLTILIGKNNQGKTYLSQLIFALQKLNASLSHPIYSIGRDRNKIEVELRMRSSPEREAPIFKGSTFSVFLPIERSDLEQPDEQVFNLIIDELASALNQLVGQGLQPILEECFGVRADRLVNINSTSSHITVSMSNYLEITMTISNKGMIKTEVRLKEVDKLRHKLIPYVSKTKANLEMLYTDRKFQFPSKIVDLILIFFRAVLGEPLSIEKIVYIPAGRAGLLEGYHSVASAFFALSPVGIIRGVSIPAMPPTAAEYYNMMHTLSGQKGPMGHICSEIAKEIIDGEIVLEKDEKQHGIPRITYHYSKGLKKDVVDIIHAGSMVKEIAGLYLAIQERIGKGTYLTVEEPEAHLHPGVQKRLSRILMKLAANGVNILLTTHSDIIIREIAHLIGQRQKTGDKDILSADDVSVTLLKEANMGSFSEELKIPESGILDGIPTFDEVITELYEEEVRLESVSLKQEQ